MKCGLVFLIVAAAAGLMVLPRGAAAAEAEIEVRARIISHADVRRLCAAAGAPLWCPPHLAALPKPDAGAYRLTEKLPPALKPPLPPAEALKQAHYE